MGCQLWTVNNQNYQALITDYYVGVNHTSNILITLPPSPDEGKVIIIKDQSGNSSNFAITITGHSGALVDGTSDIEINSNHGSKKLIYNDGTWYTI